MSGDAPRLTAAVLADMRRSVLCWLASVAPDGTPNVTPKEVFCAQEDRAVLIADIASANSVANIRAAPRVCVSFIDVFRQKGWKIAGVATIIAREEPAFATLAHDLLAIAGPSFPVRHVIRVTPSRITRILAPSYALFPDRSDDERMAEVYRRYGVRPVGADA